MAVLSQLNILECPFLPTFKLTPRDWHVNFSKLPWMVLACILPGSARRAPTLVVPAAKMPRKKVGKVRTEEHEAPTEMYE